jgi:hypothetical protein
MNLKAGREARAIPSIGLHRIAHEWAHAGPPARAGHAAGHKVSTHVRDGCSGSQLVKAKVWTIFGGGL